MNVLFFPAGGKLEGREFRGRLPPLISVGLESPPYGHSWSYLFY
jgi:hypothetical protein